MTEKNISWKWILICAAAKEEMEKNCSLEGTNLCKVDIVSVDELRDKIHGWQYRATCHYC